MKATINITTKAGVSFDGFPFSIDYSLVAYYLMFSKNFSIANSSSDYSTNKEIKLHPGDKITIEITE